MHKVHIVMPAFNESDGIEEFISEIFSQHPSYSFKVTAIDDCSSDGTVIILEKLASQHKDFSYFVNDKNSGHGITTRRAMEIALEGSCKYVCTVDGDGQFEPKDIFSIIDFTSSVPSQIGEGVRIHRAEPIFRKIVSSLTRILVYLSSGRKPKDANTPLRVYPAEELRTILESVPRDSQVPNLMISSIVRTRKIPLVERNVVSRVRRGNQESGSTWKQKRISVPSRRFIQFCVISIRDWVKFLLTK